MRKLGGFVWSEALCALATTSRAIRGLWISNLRIDRSVVLLLLYITSTVNIRSRDMSCLVLILLIEPAGLSE